MRCCSNASQSYLVYGNPVRWPSLAANDAEELSALKAALTLGQMLGRVVILPRFHCSKSTFDSGSGLAVPLTARRRGDKRFAARTNVPQTPTHECPLNALLNVTAFDSQFEGRYRESSFLRHPLVPITVRDDRSPPQDVHRRLQRSTDDVVVGDVPTTDVQLSVDDVLRMFGLSPHRVLVFQSLYRVEPRFANADQQRTFDDRVHKAFRRGTYRQL